MITFSAFIFTVSFLSMGTSANLTLQVLHEAGCGLPLIIWNSNPRCTMVLWLHGSTEHGTRGDITFCSKRGLAAPPALALREQRQEVRQAEFSLQWPAHDKQRGIFAFIWNPAKGEIQHLSSVIWELVRPIPPRMTLVELILLGHKAVWMSS